MPKINLADPQVGRRLVCSHKNTLPGASSDERDMQETSQRSLVVSAIRKARRQGLLKLETPHPQDGSCQGVSQWYATLAGLPTLELRRCLFIGYATAMKNEEQW